MKVMVVRVDDNPNVNIYDGEAEYIISDTMMEFTVLLGRVVELDWKEYASTKTSTWEERFEAAETPAEVFKILREAVT